MQKKGVSLGAHKRKLGLRARIYYLIIGCILGAAVIVTLYPILNTIAISFNEAYDTIRGGVHLLPRKFTLVNYRTVLQKDSMGTGLVVSVLRTGIGIVTHLFCTALLAFVLSRKEFIFRKQATFYYVLTMYVSGGMVPTFLLFRNLGFINSFWVYVIPGLVSAYDMIVIRTYISGLPDSLQESAMMDGAGYFTIFVAVIAPLSKPVFATIALFVGVGQWNSWFDTMLYNRMNPKLTTLQYELMKLLSTVSTMSGSSANVYGNTQSKTMLTTTSVQAAATVLTCLPIVVLYPFLQRYFVAGLTIGGVKE